MFQDARTMKLNDLVQCRECGTWQLEPAYLACLKCGRPACPECLLDEFGLCADCTLEPAHD